MQSTLFLGLSATSLQITGSPIGSLLYRFYFKAGKGHNARKIYVSLKGSQKVRDNDVNAGLEGALIRIHGAATH